jgi:hypothetical protein
MKGIKSNYQYTHALLGVNIEEVRKEGARGY